MEILSLSICITKQLNKYVYIYIKEILYLCLNSRLNTRHVILEEGLERIRFNEPSEMWGTTGNAGRMSVIDASGKSYPYSFAPSIDF